MAIGHVKSIPQLTLFSVYLQLNFFSKLNFFKNNLSPSHQGLQLFLTMAVIWTCHHSDLNKGWASGRPAELFTAAS